MGKSISLLKNTYVQHKYNSYSVGMLKLKKDGKLTLPTNKTVSNDDEIQNDSPHYDAIMEQQLTADIVSNIIYDSKADIDDWVLVKYDNLVFIGIIKDLCENE